MITEQDLQADGTVHLDLWIGDSDDNDSQAQILCEDTLGSLSDQSIFRNPSPNLVVDNRSLWDGKACHDVGSLQPFVYPSSIPAECDGNTPSVNVEGTRQLSSTQVSQNSLTYSPIQHINLSWTAMVPWGTAAPDEVTTTYTANSATGSMVGNQLGQQKAVLKRTTADDHDR